MIRSFLPDATMSTLRSFARREKGVLLLLVGTFGLVAWQHWGMERSVVLSPREGGVDVTAVDDKSDQGSSVCRIESTPQAWMLDYDVRPGGQWAFCGLKMSLQDKLGRPGMDLSGFDTLVVNLTGLSGPNTSLQVQLKSMDTNLYRPGNDATLKYQNMVLFPEHSGASRNAMPLDRFVVPPWWVARNNVPVRLLDPERKDVRQLEFLTSADVIRLGKGRFGISGLELRGKWIDQPTLLRIVIAAWLVFVVGGLIGRLYRSLVAIRTLQLRTSELQELSERDPLTRLRNRRGLENCLKGLAANLLDPAVSAVGVVLIDLDRFKMVNDSMGHDVGDEFLKLAAGILQDEIRPTNLAARWGGEEFVVLFPGISRERLATVAEGVRARLEAGLRHRGLSLTASIGVSHGTLRDWDELVKDADEALYRAKAGGRNRVELALPQEIGAGPDPLAHRPGG